ncbi:MAG: AtpZ/AtpI family protein [Gemmatimonadaceae bacterium]
MPEDQNPTPEHKPLPAGRHKVGASGGSYAGIGFQFAAVILVFLFAGQWLDHRLGTIWLTPAGVLIGAAAGIYGMYRRLVSDGKRLADARRTGKGPPGSPPR